MFAKAWPLAGRLGGIPTSSPSTSPTGEALQCTRPSIRRCSACDGRTAASCHVMSVCCYAAHFLAAAIQAADRNSNCAFAACRTAIGRLQHWEKRLPKGNQVPLLPPPLQPPLQQALRHYLRRRIAIRHCRRRSPRCCRRRNRQPIEHRQQKTRKELGPPGFCS